MKFHIGQKVSLLHESGEGKITAILDKNHVEVDLGDDFPIDVHINEIIPVDPEEDRFFKKDESEDENHQPVTQMGIHLFELSLAITPDGDSSYKFTLINPETNDYLYVFYPKIKHKYTGAANGKVRAGGKDLLCVLSKDQLSQTRSLYFQFLQYKEGPGVPHQPIVRELNWGKNRLAEPPRRIPPLGQDGWLIPVKEVVEASRVDFSKSEFITHKQEQIVPIPSKVIDLHIEELVAKPHELAPSEMLRVQLEHFERELSQALIDNVEKLVIIHGVGEGKLRNEIRRILRESDEIKSFSAADPVKFGNGATEAILA